MSESNLNMDMMDIIIPDEASIVEPQAEILETVETDPVDPIEPTVETPPIEKLDTSLSGVEGDPIDSDPPENGGEVYQTLAEVLKEEGFFQEEGAVTKIKSVEDLAQAFREEMKKNEYSDLNDSQKRALEGFRNGIPEAEVIKHEQNLQQFNSITDDVLGGNVELQKAIYVTDLVNKGISERRAESMYTLALDSGELLDEARVSLTALKQSENVKYQTRIDEQKATADKQATAKANDQKAIKKSIYDVEKFMGELKITQNLKEKVHDSMTHIVAHTEDGVPLNALMKARQEDPLDFETKLYYLFELTDGFSNLKRFSKQADSKAAKKLESLIQNNTFIKDSSAPAYAQDSESFDPGGIVELM